MVKTKEIKRGDLAFWLPKKIFREPVLSIIVPAYNVEEYLYESVMTFVCQRNAGKVEILIVNDGSKDKTEKIAKELVKLTTVGEKSIVRLINKKNGGHGSTINVGVREARGKYVKVIDGDDSVESEELARFIDALETEDADLVLSDYTMNFASEGRKEKQVLYKKLTPGKKYKFDELLTGDFGFNQPFTLLLHSSTYRREKLVEADFLLPEHCFYVDMELNTRVATIIQTVVYYDFNVYQYLLGREGQSVSPEKYMKQYKQHERVLLDMIQILEEKKAGLSNERVKYISDFIIMPMIRTHYWILITLLKDKEKFLEFDKKLEAYPEIYNSKYILNDVLFERKTKGKFIKYNAAYVKGVDKLVRAKGFAKRIVKK